jgi:hypothetical protein
LRSVALDPTVANGTKATLTRHEKFGDARACCTRPSQSWPRVTGSVNGGMSAARRPRA